MFSTSNVERAERIHTDFLAEVSNWLVVLVEDDADLVHEADLLLIVPLKCGAGGIDVREESEDVVRRDGLNLGGRSLSSHFQSSYSVSISKSGVNECFDVFYNPSFWCCAQD